jgi:hypothetical protein
MRVREQESGDFAGLVVEELRVWIVRMGRIKRACYGDRVGFVDDLVANIPVHAPLIFWREYFVATLGAVELRNEL